MELTICSSSSSHSRCRSKIRLRFKHLWCIEWNERYISKNTIKMLIIIANIEVDIVVKMFVPFLCFLYRVLVGLK
jgi:hypothetical protein